MTGYPDITRQGGDTCRVAGHSASIASWLESGVGAFYGIMRIEFVFSASAKTKLWNSWELPPSLSRPSDGPGSPCNNPDVLSLAEGYAAAVPPSSSVGVGR
jgi:hypothetical protein